MLNNWNTSIQPELLTFASSAIINLLIPSGGGQWAIQAPIILNAARDSIQELTNLLLCFSYGDQLTNWIQPFWALPVLAMTGVSPWLMLRYGAVFCLTGFVTTLLGITFL